jgi:hypothetical protein
MGVYSTAYQDVTAGRVREDEGIAFYGKNRVATPPNTFEISNTGDSKQPTIAVDHLHDTGVARRQIKEMLTRVHMMVAVTMVQLRKLFKSYYH